VDIRDGVGVCGGVFIAHTMTFKVSAAIQCLFYL
jgi:hypothetical protein